MRRVLGFVLFFLIFGAVSAAGEPAQSTEELYAMGLVHLRDRKDAQAAEVFDDILSLDPEIYEAQWGRAEALRRLHRLEESEEALKKLLKAHPDFSPAYITLARIRYIRMDFEGAVRLGKKVLQAGPLRADKTSTTAAYLIVGDSKGMLAYYGGPIAKTVHGIAVAGYLKAAEKLQPGSAAVDFSIGSYYLLAPPAAGRDINKAEEYLKRAMASDPRFSDVYVRLAQVYRMKADKDKYREYLNRALEIDPENELGLDIKSGRCKFVCPSP